MAYLFIIFSVAITVSHDIFAHHHHTESIHYQDHEDEESEEGHNIFSFGQLDEIYTLSNGKIYLISPFVFLGNPQSEFLFSLNFSANQEFSIVEIFPPPDNVYCQANILRGPPLS